jgi:phospholipase D1/2
MPFLLPPAEFKPGELTQMGLTGTCELQICRSAGPWSLGTLNKVEHSIQNAYLKGLLDITVVTQCVSSGYPAIQMSEHFVYIENQFFITRHIFFPLCRSGWLIPRFFNAAVLLWAT